MSINKNYSSKESKENSLTDHLLKSDEKRKHVSSMAIRPINSNSSSKKYYRRSSTTIKEYAYNISYAETILKLFSRGLPATVSLFFIFLNEMVNIIFIGKYCDYTAISATGIGNLYINATGYILGIGLLGGLDTLCSQCFGARQFYLLGLYSNISRICLLVFFLLVTLPFILFTEYFLYFFGLSPEVARLATIYVKSMIPSILFSLQYHASIRYLQALDIFIPGMCVTLITCLLHPLICWVLVGYFALSVKGAGLAMGFTNFFNFILISLYIHYKNPYPGSYFCFDKNSVDLKRIYDFLKMGISSAIMFAADWLGFEVIILFSSYIDAVSFASNVVIFNFMSLVLSIPLGLSFAVSTLVGIAIGSKRPQLAKIIAVLGVFIALLLTFILTQFAISYKDSFSHLYTTNTGIIGNLGDILFVAEYFGPLNALQIMLNAVVKGLGKQKTACVFVLIILYPINIPLALTLTFLVNYGLIGLWYSLLNAVILLSFSYIVFLVSIDWEIISMRAVAHLNKVSMALNLKQNYLTDKEKV